LSFLAKDLVEGDAIRLNDKSRARRVVSKFDGTPRSETKVQSRQTKVQFELPPAGVKGA
jgi:hypothetical protein